MPELPEVETTRRGIEPFLTGHTIQRVHVRNHRLRWPVSLPEHLSGSPVLSVSRRAKYLLIETQAGALVVHLGMSGSLRVVSPDEKPRIHDHVDIEIQNGPWLRYNDPRRFGISPTTCVYFQRTCFRKLILRLVTYLEWRACFFLQTPVLRLFDFSPKPRSSSRNLIKIIRAKLRRNLSGEERSWPRVTFMKQTTIWMKKMKTRQTITI